MENPQKHLDEEIKPEYPTASVEEFARKTHNNNEPTYTRNK